MLKAMGRGIYKKEPMLGARSLVRFLVDRKGIARCSLLSRLLATIRARTPA